MPSGFLVKVADWLRKLFGWKKQGKKASTVIIEKDIPGSSTVHDNFIRPRHFLLKGGNPVGRSRSRRHPDIRCVTVDNFTGAYRFFIRLCDQRLIVFRQVAGVMHYELKLSDGTVIFDLTDKTTGRPQGTVAVLRINKEKSGVQIKEIEFVQSKK